MTTKAYVMKGEDATFDQQVDFYKFLQVGRIVRVDNEKNLIDIQFGSNPVLSRNVPITNPFFTGRSLIGGMPEEGSVVICGYIKLTNKMGMPIVIAYLDKAYYKSLAYIYDQGKTSEGVKDLKSIHDKIGWNVKRLKKRKLYPGDIDLESTQGSEIVLNDGIIISDSKFNEILLSNSDRTIYSNSINNHLYTNASRILNGLAIRPNAPNIEPVVLDNGLYHYVITDGGSADNGNIFTEIRTEVRETASNVLDVIESFEDDNFATDTSKGRLVLEHVFGTVIGNNKQEIDKYGRVLRPQIYGSEDNRIVVEDIVCKPNEYYDLASAYQMKFASGAKFDIDKQGHTFIYLPGSSVKHPLGAGRSLEFASDGMLKFVIGKTNSTEKSIELNTLGFANIKFGSDSETLKSLNLIMDRAANIKVNAPDSQGVALREEYAGHLYQTIAGDKVVNVNGSLKITVKGKIEEKIEGAKIENYVNDKMTNYGGDYQEIITGQKQTKIGDGHIIDIGKTGTELTILEGDIKEKLILGSKEVNLLSGDSKESLILGNKETNLTAGDLKEKLLAGNREAELTLGDHIIDVKTGNIQEKVKLGDSTESITTGNKDINIKVGDFTVSITKGEINISTTAGSVNVASKTGEVVVNGMRGVEVKSTAKVVVKAPKVELGQLPATMGGIVTGLPGIPSHFDYLTGSPLKGSATIKATM